MTENAHQPRLIAETESEYKLTPEEQARKDAYRERLRQYLHDPEFRKIPGFPIGDDEAILKLSDPPYYTACPNPFLSEIIDDWQQERAEIRKEFDLPDTYHREPFAADVSEGKNNPIYNAHSYHTKVPHPAIMRYILHYTDPGDVVFDGFCGTGMTGVAAQLCGDRTEVEKLGYFVDEEGWIYEKPGDTEAISRLGARKAALNDLSPVATFIAYNYNTPVNVDAFEKEANRILAEVEAECGWMYETWHPHCDDPNRVKAMINYMVWSEVFLCPNCSQEVVFLDEGLDLETMRVKKEFPCPGCGTLVSKRVLDKLRITQYDPDLGQTFETLKRVPTTIEYRIGKIKHTKRADADDLAVLDRIENIPLPVDFVQDELPYMHMTHQRAKMANYGITHFHHFFLHRARQALYKLWKKANDTDELRLRNFLLFTVEQAIWTMSLLNRYRPTGYSQVNQYLAGVYYISSLISEVSPWYILTGKTKRLVHAYTQTKHKETCTAITTQSTTTLSGIKNSIDYIFMVVVELGL